jgi:hypothetical protein
MPDQVRHDDSRTFYETVNLNSQKDEPDVFYIPSVGRDALCPENIIHMKLNVNKKIV